MVKQIPGFTDYYVTYSGNVYAYKPDRWGHRHRHRHKLKPHDTGKEHMQITLVKNKKRHTFYIHRLVANAFVPNPNKLAQVHHIDENSYNNCANNLVWMSRPEHNSLTHKGKVWTKEGRANYQASNDVIGNIVRQRNKKQEAINKQRIAAIRSNHGLS